MKTYEYKWLHIPGSNNDSGKVSPDALTRLNEAGQDGWEFTGEIVHGYYTSLYFMKRVVKVKKAKKQKFPSLGGISFDEALRSLGGCYAARERGLFTQNDLTQEEIATFRAPVSSERAGRIVFTVTNVNDIMRERLRKEAAKK